MRAAIYKKYGGPEVLKIEEISAPKPKAQQVLVKVKATTVNRTDCAMLTAKPFLMRFMTGLFNPKNPILGTDFAGVIATVGEDVKNYKVGDEVFGFNDDGLSSHAAYLTVNAEKNLLKKPTNITFEQAAASIEGFHYAYNTVNKIKLQKGDKVLVNGATGAIGSAALQLAVHFGAIVTAVGNTKNMDLMKSMGATTIIDYTKEDFTKRTAQFDYVFDTVGKSSFGKCKPLLKSKGVYISSELGWGAQNIFYALVTPIFGQKKVVFPFPSKIQESLELVKTLMIEGKFKPVIDRKYPLEQIAAAYRYVLTGQKTGNVIITYKKGH